jgi:DNA-binding MarR family transcriptional regulator
VERPADEHPSGRTRSADAVRAAARLAKVAGSALAEVDLTLPQYRVLVFLSLRARPASDVAALLGVTPSTVTSVVDGLVERHLVERRPDTTDRRRVVLSLTRDGERLVTTGDRVVGERIDRLLDRLAPAEAETALVGLELLNVAMEAVLDERFGPPGPGT